MSHSKVPVGQCPYCGSTSLVDVVVTGGPNDREDRAVARCTACDQHYVSVRTTSYPVEDPTDPNSLPHV